MGRDRRGAGDRTVDLSARRRHHLPLLADDIQGVEALEAFAKRLRG